MKTKGAINGKKKTNIEDNPDVSDVQQSDKENPQTPKEKLKGELNIFFEAQKQIHYSRRVGEPSLKEQSILKMRGLGLDNKRIAIRMKMTEQYVGNILKRIDQEKDSIFIGLQRRSVTVLENAEIKSKDELKYFVEMHSWDFLLKFRGCGHRTLTDLKKWLDK